jgi:hypothetical protein
VAKNLLERVFVIYSVSLLSSGGQQWFVCDNLIMQFFQFSAIFLIKSYNFTPKSPSIPNDQSANKVHLVAFFIRFQKTIALKIPPGKQGLLVDQWL